MQTGGFSNLGRWALICAVLFTVFARIDLWASGLFFVDGRFPLAGSAGLEAIRQIIWALAIVFALACLGAFALSFRIGILNVPTRIWGGLTFLFLLGPGLIVNGLLKPFWGRARPVDIEAFGGAEAFSPALMISDACERNCSFVSGEAAGAIALAIAIWVLAGSLPPKWQSVLRNIAIGIGIVGPLLRVMVGAHFLSDVLFAALIVAGLAHLLLRERAEDSAPVAKAPDLTPIPLRLVEGSYDRDFAVVIPALNEADNIRSLADRIEAAMQGRNYELIVVDDGSIDGTGARLADGPDHWRLLRHETPAGQSAAVHTGVKAARAPIIVTLDGDGQNPPEEIPKLLEIWDRRAGDDALGLVAGQRMKRIDTFAKRYASRFANGLRARALNDGTRDTGCGLKAFRRDVFLSLPFFNHMHRYLPALTNRAGYAVDHVDVNHAAREAGASKYTNLQRGLVGAVDLLGVMWLIRRKKTASPRELDPNAGPSQ